jgi:hypothetical protein
MRCLKRYIAREVFNSLRADLAGTAQPQATVSTTSSAALPTLPSTKSALDSYRNVSGQLTMPQRASPPAR